MVVGAAPLPPPTKKSLIAAKKSASAAPLPSTKGVDPNTSIGDPTLVAAAANGGNGKKSDEGGRPDKGVYDKEQDRLRKEIDVLQSKVNAIKLRLEGISKPPPATVARKTALRTELDSLRGAQASLKSGRGKTLDQVKVLQENLGKKIKDLQEKKGKLGFKTVGEVEGAIKALEKQVESGTMKLVDEKKALIEISQLKKSRKNVEGLTLLQTQIDADKAKLDAIRSGLDDPEARSVADKFDTLRKELDEINKDLDRSSRERDGIWEERNVVMKELDALFTQKKEEAAKFREANNKFYQKQQEDRTRRLEKQRLERTAFELSKVTETNLRLLEEAQAPAYEREIEDCRTLIDYFHKRFNATVSEEEKKDSEKAGLAGVPELKLRVVDAAVPAGAVAAKKKGEVEEEYFMGGGGGKKGRKGRKVESVKEVGEEKLNLPFPTLGALLQLGIGSPLTKDDVQKTVESLELKKKFFTDNQERVTKEKIAAVEKKIAAAEAKAAAAAPSTPGDSTPVTNGEEVRDAVAVAEE